MFRSLNDIPEQIVIASRKERIKLLGVSELETYFRALLVICLNTFVDLIYLLKD